MQVQGVYTALITPFDKNGNVDFNALEKNIKFQIENNVDGILFLGTTAETPTLTEKEKEDIVKTGVKLCKGKVKIMVGTGTNSTLTTIENTNKYHKLGAEIALVVTPYYNKPTQNGIYLHFKEVTEKTQIPILVYNIQGRTGTNINTDTLKKISKLNNICGVKEASGNINQIMDVINSINNENPDFTVLSGDDGLTYPLLSLGGHGVISVVSNLIPGSLVEMVNHINSGNYKKARDIHYKLLDFFKGAFIETNPVPIKKSMELIGYINSGVRLPLCEMEEENIQTLTEILKKSGIL